LREQIYFQRNGTYRYSSFDEVAHAVYFDDSYMRKYMHGLALTAYLWPNHRALHRYFVDMLPTNQGGNYLEIGPGHGMYLMSAMRKCVYNQFDGIDISPTSVEMTESLLSSGKFGEFSNYRIFEQDFLAGEIPTASYNAIVMGEVLEHVEKPNIFLESIARIATDNAFIFITTPINAPAVDHIYLFDSWNSIESLITGAGLMVQEKMLVPYPGLSVDESMQQSLPINVAAVLTK
jgi:2-polyprenyl-3-methyl-5-hydroxy-6-metoxy-1,4-benzoquinol methylase